MRTLQIVSCIAVLAILALARARGDDDPDGFEFSDEDTAEPITGEAVMPNPGSEQPMRDPFTPYDIGGEAAAWRLEDLSPEEQAVALRGTEDDQSAVQAAYAEVAREIAERARAASLANQLGVGELGEIGVVP